MDSNFIPGLLAFSFLTTYALAEVSITITRIFHFKAVWVLEEIQASYGSLNWMKLKFIQP